MREKMPISTVAYLNLKMLKSHGQCVRLDTGALCCNGYLW